MLIVTVMAGCSRTPAPVRDAPVEQLTLAQGAGNWVVFEQELALEALIDQTLELPYARTGTGASLPTSQVKRIVLQFHAAPLQPEDRCGLQLRKITVVTADDQEHVVAASGYVTDNSDGLKGMRIEVARSAGTGLVIPARATATVVFDHAVRVPLLRR
jgi:hypothetical protein